MAMNIRDLLVLCLVRFISADLRMASQPRRAYWLINQGTTPWNITPTEVAVKTWHYRYMEPSTFKYKGLEHQKRRNYDNFLRSNIDNEQDNRNFNDEEGKDHLPFRTYEAAVFDEYGLLPSSGIKQLPLALPLTKTAQPGQSLMVPLRWNNPHASEMEVNIWIFEHASKQPIVVPIRKPTCSGEGHQDNIISFTIPKDFTALGAKIPGFKGCREDSKPMCTLQIYAHSVESRTYAIGFPIVIPGHEASKTTTVSEGIRNASGDPWLELGALRDICLPSTAPLADIPTAMPRWARLVSDVYNHAYQNSDYSPYSGQQHEHISKNLQASAINKMVTGNRGELGKSILPKRTYNVLRGLRSLESKIYKNYEALANNIIKALGSKMQNTGTIGSQPLANCFRCQEVGSTNTKRLQTNTYIPSFRLPQELVPAARKLVPAKYSTLITDSGLVQIYVAAMTDLLPFFYQSRHLGIMYQEAVVKSTTTTMIDDTSFKKRNAEGAIDGGKYAALQAKKKFVSARGCPSNCLYATGTDLLQENDAAITIKGAPCRGNDCQSVAKCPSGHSVVKCESNPANAGDGIHLTQDMCYARSASRASIQAIATCSPQQTSVAASSEMYLDRQEVVASCGGTPPLGCYCYSPWTTCRSQTSFAASGSLCKQKVGSSTRHRRRGVGGGAGVKVYALCGKETNEKTNDGPKTEIIEITGLPCSGDDCKSDATCPSGYSVIKCESRPPHSGDGLEIAGQQCRARGALHSGPIKAIATCSLKETSVVSSGAMYLDSKEVVAKCPDGVSTIGCYCLSPWSSCWETSFAPSGSQCKQVIGASVSHRRRNVEGGAGARIYALCGNGITVPADSLELPLVSGSSGTSIIGVCASCTKLFGSFRVFEHHAPPVTRLASDVQSADGEGLADEGALTGNPDNGSPTRRRRRGAALIQEIAGETSKVKMQNPQ